MENKKYNKVVKLSDLKANPIKRNRTWLRDLDALYGTSDLPEHNIGMPKGKISLWAGESGVGKSRLCIEVAKRFSTRYDEGIVLYIQTEAPLEDFASWVKDTSKYSTIYCSGVETQKDIIDVIYQVRPKLIFIDSVNEIVDFIGNAKSATRLIKGDGDMIGLKQATNDVGAHCILLGQLNQDGKTIKGGTSLPHLVDVALNVVWEDKVKGRFKVEVGVKHRYGSRDKTAIFKHTNDGVTDILPVVSAPAPVQNNGLPPGYRRVPAMTRSGFCTMGPNGVDHNDPEFLEHMVNYRASRANEVNVKPSGISTYMKIGNFLGNMLGK